jgi:ABC-type lipoprotein export system ATPase subunit
MPPPRAKDISFTNDDQANQTMILDLESTVIHQRPPVIADEPTMVLDLTATQVRDLLEDTDKDGKA